MASRSIVKQSRIERNTTPIVKFWKNMGKLKKIDGKWKEIEAKGNR